MASIRFLSTSLILVLIFLSTPPGDVSKKACVKLTRANIEKILGPPVECFKQPGNVSCYGNKFEPIRVRFNSSGVAESIEIITSCHGLRSLKPKLDKIVPEKDRGNLIPRKEWPDRTSCITSSEEEYECVKIRYAQDNCMGCIPASISLVWK